MTNWPIKKLGEVASVYGGGTAPTNIPEYYQGNINWFTPTELPSENVCYVSESVRKISEPATKFTTISGTNSVLLSSRATIGNVALISTPSAYNQGIKGIEPKKEEIDNWFLAYWLKANKDKLLKKSFGTTFKEISTSSVKDLDITVPSLNVQKKIVERLDSIRKAQELCDQQIQKTEELFESILEEELNKLDKAEIKKLAEVCDVRDGTHDSPKYQNSGIPLITSKNLKDNEIDFLNINYISEKDHEQIIKRSFVENGDILFGMIGTIGNPVLVNTNIKFSIKNVGLIKFPNKAINNYFVKYFLQSKTLMNQINRLARGGTQKFVSLGNLRNLEIPVPPISEQQKIVEKLEAVQNYKKLLLKQKSLLKELFDSVLDKSMKGELD